MLRGLRIGILVMLFMLPGAFSVALSPGVTDNERQAVRLVNADRLEHGLAALTLDPQLVAVARRHAADMMERDYFSHNSPEGMGPFDRMKKAGIRYQAAGENIYKGTGDPTGEEVAVAEQFLMTSPGHRRNILDADFTEIGIGVVRSENGWTYVVQCFIKP